MSKLIDGDDGLIAEDVGIWSKYKHDMLRRYVDISRMTRAKYLGAGKGGAAYIDLFCGTGRALIRETGEWIDGGAVAAWNKSVQGGQPFTNIIIADADEERLQTCEKRLLSLGAPVTSILGKACDTALPAFQKAPYYGLNFAFLDPYNLEALDFAIISTLARLKRVDMLIHVSTMDLQRNLVKHVTDKSSAFDTFSPGWRNEVNLQQSNPNIREEVFRYWRDLVAKTSVKTSEDVQLVTGSRNQRLYWLLLAASHQLAHKFWKEAVDNGQGALF